MMIIPNRDSDGNEISTSEPFAVPKYRTKRNATNGLVSVEASQVVTIDYKLTEEMFCHGGEIIFTGMKFGDYLSAEIHDVEGVIPLEYRTTLCEAHPVVARYILKQWLPEGNGSKEISTYPLNAKITPGLYLRITVHTTADLGTRKCAVNYYLTKKL